MTREHAALLLGVDCDASEDRINHAWRVWAKLAHPDVGGDRQHFEALARARSLLVQHARARSHQEPEPVPPIRTSLRGVCRRPSRRGAIAVVATTVLMILVVLVPWPWSDVAAAFAAGAAASAWAVVLERSTLVRSADTGHRITVLTLAWLPAATLLSLVTATRGVPVIGLLPVVALPFVGVVALVNPGAGLWRPIADPAS